MTIPATPTKRTSKRRHLPISGVWPRRGTAFVGQMPSVASKRKHGEFAGKHILDWPPLLHGVGQPTGNPSNWAVSNAAHCCFPNRYLEEIMRIGFAASLLIGFSLAGSASATLVDQGATTLDTTTGLTWLDLTYSTNMSTDDVRANFAPGGLFAGYRYATRSEVNKLFVDAGFGTGAFFNNSGDEPPYTHVARLISLLGVTYSPGSGGQAFRGYYLDHGAVIGTTLVATYGAYNSQASIDVDGSLATSGGPSPELGSMLVAQAVPEPSQAALLLGGIVAGGIYRARRHAKKAHSVGGIHDGRADCLERR